MRRMEHSQHFDKCIVVFKGGKICRKHFDELLAIFPSNFAIQDFIFKGDYRVCIDMCKFC